MTISIDQLRISYKNPCRIATTTNINLATTGLTAIDGITPVEEDRILVKDQSTGSENGIYIAKAGAWVRSKDFDVSSNDNIVGQVEVRIQEGATNGGKRFVLTNTGTITIGSTSLVFSESSALSDHTALLNLAWTGSNHTGTANHIPFFDGSGAPSTSDDLIWDGSDLGVTGTVTINSAGTSLTLEPGAANARRISLGSQTGGGPPQFSSYSPGMRILLFDNVNGGNVGYGFGMDGAHVWSAVSQNTNGWAFDWFAGTDRLATIYALGDGLELLETNSLTAGTTAGYGRFWIKDDAPNVAYFTDDASNNWELAKETDDVTFNNVTGSNFRVTGVIETDAIPRIEPVYIRGTGNNNPANRIVRVGNTTHVNATGTGLTLTVLTASDHSLVSTTNYNTFNDDTSNTNLATALDDLTRDEIGILTSYDAWERNTDAQRVTLFTAARRLGLFRLANFQTPTPRLLRQPYAAIFRGAGTGTGNTETFQEVIEVLHDRTGSVNYAQIVTWMADGAFIHTPPVQELVGRPDIAGEDAGRLRVFGNEYIESDLSIQLTASSLTSDPTTSRRIMFDDDTSTVVAVTDTGGNPDLAYRVNAASHTFFDQTTSLVDISSAGVTSSINIVPDTDDALDLGSTTLSWANLYLASKIHYKSDLEFVSASNRLIRFGNTGSIDVQNHGINTPFGGLGKLENLIDYSEDLTPGTGNWLTPTAGSSITANAATAPDGEVTADLFEVAAGSASGSYLHRNSAGLGGTTYTLFFWAKKGTGDFVLRVDIGDGASSGDITLTDEWVRYRKVLTRGGAAHVDFLISGHDNGTASQMYLWGVQVCEGDVDYPYYPTRGTTKSLGRGAIINGNQFITGTIKTDGYIELYEQSNSPSASAGSGFVWSKGTEPQTLVFTDDTGADYHAAGQIELSGSGPVTPTDGDIWNITGSLRVWVTVGSSIVTASLPSPTEEGHWLQIGLNDNVGGGVFVLSSSATTLFSGFNIAADEEIKFAAEGAHVWLRSTELWFFGTGSYHWLIRENFGATEV